MPRRSRVVIAGIAQHVTQRGNDQQAVFLSSADRRLYLDLLSHHAGCGGLRIVGYCLMTNHVHLVAVPERGDSLARVLGRAHGEYAQAFNRSSGRSGHVWQNRFFSCLLDQAGLAAALRYVELNPVRAGMAEQAWLWPWSSAAAHVDEDAADTVLDPQWRELVGRWNGAEWREILAAGVDSKRCGVRSSRRRYFPGQAGNRGGPPAEGAAPRPAEEGRVTANESP